MVTASPADELAVSAAFGTESVRAPNISCADALIAAVKKMAETLVILIMVVNREYQSACQPDDWISTSCEVPSVERMTIVVKVF